MHPRIPATSSRSAVLLVLALLAALLAAGFAHAAPAAAEPAPTAESVLELAPGSPAVPCPAGEPAGDPHCGAAITAPSGAMAMPSLRDPRSLSDGRAEGATEPKGRPAVPATDLRLLSIDRR